MLAAVHAALVPFGLLQPALESEIVPRDDGLFPSSQQPRGTAGHDAAHVVPNRLIARLALPLQDLTLRQTLGTRPRVWFERRLNRLDSRHIGPNGCLGVVDRCQPPVNVPRSTRESRVRRPPCFASRFRWSAACTSSKASAMRSPGGCRGPP